MFKNETLNEKLNQHEFEKKKTQFYSRKTYPMMVFVNFHRTINQKNSQNKYLCITDVQFIFRDV